MLRAALFPDFKGHNTLLLWGSNEAMAHLRARFLDVRLEKQPCFTIMGGSGLTELSVTLTKKVGVSIITGTENGLHWRCSPQVLDDAIYLTETLLNSPGGHQYVDTDGSLADQIMISVNEYPDDFRRKVR